MMRLAAAAWTLTLAAPCAAAASGVKVYSLDQCADQYVLALAPRERIAALSPRADDADSHLRRLAERLPRRRAALEPILASGATVVVRYWGGDAQLTAALARRGVKVATIADAHDFSGVAANIRRIAAMLGERRKAEVLVAGMQARLTAAQGAGGKRRALYLTSGGFTAGPDTLIGAMLSAAGWANASVRPGYQPVGLERLVLSPPQALVLGYFDAASLAAQRWAFGRHRAVRQISRGRPAVALPSSILGCPAWFAADGAALLAQHGGRR